MRKFTSIILVLIGLLAMLTSVGAVNAQAASPVARFTHVEVRSQGFILTQTANIPATRYDVRRSTNEADWSVENSVGTRWFHQPLTAGTRYYFQVRAYNSSGPGPWSASWTGIGGTLASPQSISAPSSVAPNVTLTWGRVSGATGYVIRYRPTTETASEYPAPESGWTEAVSYTHLTLPTILLV